MSGRNIEGVKLMSKQLEFDFGEEFKSENKIVDFDGGHFIYQSDIDEYEKAIQLRKKRIGSTESIKKLSAVKSFKGGN